MLTARGDTPIGLIRKQAQEADLRDAGAEPLVLDLEDTTVQALSEAMAGADAVVFAAGAGGGNPERTDTVDRQGAVTLAEAAAHAGIRRYLLLSSFGASADASDEDFGSMGPYLRAKGKAEEQVQAIDGIDVTVLRPGGLTDDAGSGTVRLEASVDRGKVTRDDVAAVLVALLDAPGTVGRTLELISGDTPIAEAVRAVG